MATSIECSACGHTVPGDQPFCGMCGTPAHSSPGTEDAVGAPPTLFREAVGHVRVPWSLGLLGLLVMGSVLFGGDDPPEIAFPDTAAATSQPETETVVELPDPSLGVVAEAADPEIDASDAKEAAAARLALIEAEQQAEEQRGRELNDSLAGQAEADLLRRLEEEAEAEYAAALAAAVLAAEQERADRESANRENNDSVTPPASKEPGSLRLIVLPFGDIYVNGALQARDMSRFELALPPGTHQVRLENANRQPVDTTVVVRAGESTSVRITLPSRNDE